MPPIFKYWKLVVFEIGNSRRSRAGFTLVEIIMYMGILAFLLLILTQLLSSILGIHLESQASSAIQQDGRFILARLTYDINRAESIVLPATPSAQSSSLQQVLDSITNTYSLSGGNLLITNNLGSDNLNSYGTTVSNLSFRRLGNIGGKNTITIAFTLQSVTAREKGPEVKNFQITAGTR